jgi:hypothetical protein
MQEQRKDLRFQKQDPLMYSLKDKPEVAYKVSSLIDISKGGLKFTCVEEHPVGTILIFHIKLPFLYPIVPTFEGKIIGVGHHNQMKIYQVRVQFTHLDPQAAAALQQMENIHSKKNS